MVHETNRSHEPHASSHEPLAHSYEPHHRFTLRQLPMPAKLVLSTFLIAVGLGYASAMWQLHMQGTEQDGEFLPTPSNVITRYSGLEKFNGQMPELRSKIEILISGHPEEGWPTKNMAPAFFGKSGGEYAKDLNKRGKIVTDEREGEQNAMLAWVRADGDTRKKAYNEGEVGKFTLPAELVGKPITNEFVEDEGKILKVKLLVDKRCVKCHSEGDQKPVLSDYKSLEKYINRGTFDVIDGKWVKSPGKQMSVGTLTQSTHTHALSYAVLFSCTGLIFAFTRFPSIIRGFFGPLVVISVSADITCWWLARLAPPYGPFFAYGIIACGGIAGLGLSIQIFGSLFDMYRWRGRFILLLITLPITIGGVVVALNVIQPALDEEKKITIEKKLAEEKKVDEEKKAAEKPPDEQK